MFCEKCGTKLTEKGTFCHNCGYKSSFINGEENIQQPNQGADIFALFNKLFASSLFLAACVLITVQSSINVIIALAMFNLLAIPIPVLVTVSAWLIRFSAKNANAAGYKTPFKILSVITTIEWVVVWVLVGIMGAAAIACFALSGEVGEILPEIYAELDMDYFVADDTVAMFGIILGFVFLAVAIISAVLNIFCYGNFRKCAKSFAVTAESGQMVIYKLRTTKVWLIVLAVLNGISALNALAADFLSFVAVGCSVAFIIILVLIAEKIIKETNCN